MRPDTLLFFGAALAYLATAVFHHAHLFTGSVRSRRLARSTVLAAVLLHGAGLTMHAAVMHRCPFVDSAATISFMAWCLGLMELVIELRYDWIAIGSLSMPIAFLAVVSANLLPHAGAPADPFLTSHWLSPHVFAVSLGFASFALAFCFAVAYQVESYLLKPKHKHDNEASTCTSAVSSPS